MQLIELHILQSFPVTCLNRDDLGSPKSALFGGATRARISSQCIKRAIRLTATELRPDAFQGQHSRLIIEPLISRFIASGIENSQATKVARTVADELATLDERAAKEGRLRVKTLMFLSPAELDAIANAMLDVIKTDVKPKDLAKAAAKAARGVALKDAADIAIFGRMVASDHSLTVEGAGLFSHALSTHKVDNEIDFFAAVDDLQSQDEAGAGMTGTVEFNSATYYRYAALNIDLLKKNLSSLDTAQHKSVVDTFLRAALVAVPGARKNSMNGATLPGYVLGVVKVGQPLQLINAFETPVNSRSGIEKESEKRLKEHHEHLKKTWNLATKVEVAIPDVDLKNFCSSILDAVFPA